MGTRTLFRLAVGICIVGAVSAQYPYNSLYRDQEKDTPFRPSYYQGSQEEQYQQQQPNTTPAPEEKAKFAKIMKQINKVNDDGSYTFGFENDDGSFRVETRTKDGIVKGKYGFIDGNGQLKVTEYTAGEKSDEPEGDAETTESEEEGGDFKRPRPAGPGSRSLPLSARPQAQQSPSYYSQPQPLASRPAQYSAPPTPYHAGARGHAFDQAPAAQTSSGNVARAPPTSDDDFSESFENDANGFSSRQSTAGQEDPLNNQYFRSSVTPAGGSAAGARGRFPAAGAPQQGAGISAAGRPLPGAYAQQYPGAYSPASPQQYGGAGGSQGFPGAGAPQQYSGPSGPFIGSPQFGAPQGFVQGPAPQGFTQGPPPQGFRRQAPQDFSSIGAPQAGASPQSQGQGPTQSIQNFGGFGGFNTKQSSGKGQSGSSEIPVDEQYVPSVELDGYSEDLDQDGYPDEPPKDGKVPPRSGSSGASPQSFRPSPSFNQGGIQSGGAPHRGSPAPSPQVILQLGAQGQLGGGGGRFPGPQQGPVGLQGGIPQYNPQQSFGGFPQGAEQGFPQGFPQGFEGQGGFQGFPQQFASTPQSAAGQRGASGGSPIQSDGFPYDFNPFGGVQGYPQQGFQQGNPQGFPVSAGAPGAGFPIQQGQFPESGGPGSTVQNFGGFPGGAGGPQGFPIQSGRFTQAGGAQGAPGGAQSYLSGGAYPGGLGGQASPTAGGIPSSSPEQKNA